MLGITYPNRSLVGMAESLKKNAHWLSDLPLSPWQRVLADEEGRVTQLLMGADGPEPLMSGNLPRELGSLSQLEALVLHGELYGGILLDLGNLSNLTHPVLSYKDLTGVVPPALGQLKNPTLLDLRYNKLSGQLPEQLTSLPK